MQGTRLSTPLTIHPVRICASRSSTCSKQDKLGDCTILLENMFATSVNFSLDGASAGLPAEDTLVYHERQGQLTSMLALSSSIAREAGV